QSALQTDDTRGRVGSDPAFGDNADFHLFLWKTRSYSHGWRAISSICLHGSAAVDVLLERRDQRRQQFDWQQQPDHKGVLPEVDNSSCSGGRRVARFCDRFCAPGWATGLLSFSADVELLDDPTADC